MIQSKLKQVRKLKVPHITGELSMLPFDMKTLKGIPEYLLETVKAMVEDLTCLDGLAFLTTHGQLVLEGDTLRRPAPHIDGNFINMQWGGGGGGNGWKVGENGPAVGSPEHADSYWSKTGGLLMASNVSACRGWEGNYAGFAGVGGDCRHIHLHGKPVELEADTLYYGNTSFIHESMPVKEDVHRSFVRITLPAEHEYEGE